MYRILFKPSFIRQVRRLGKNRYELLKDRVELLKDRKNHHFLKVHKLHGELSDCYSFSLDYDFRVIFTFESKDRIVLLDLGNHDIYK